MQQTLPGVESADAVLPTSSFGETPDQARPTLLALVKTASILSAASRANPGRLPRCTGVPADVDLTRINGMDLNQICSGPLTFSSISPADPLLVSMRVEAGGRQRVE